MRKPVRFSEAATAASIVIELSLASDCMNRTISPSDSRGWWPDTMTSVTAMAPALMKGLRGTPRSRSSCTMELNGLPEGSRPTRRHNRSPIMPSASVRVKTLEMLWIEKAASASPAAATLPSVPTTAMPNWPGSTLASSGM